MRFAVNPPRVYRYPWEVTRLRREPGGGGVCIDEACELSYGDAHIGPCEPCTCGEEHAIAECAAFRTAWAAIDAREERLGAGAKRTELARLKPAQRIGDAWACRWCDKPCPGRRTSYCSEVCKHEFRQRAEPGYLRDQVEQRDHGVCATCSLNPGAWKAARDLEEQRLRVLEREETELWFGPRSRRDAIRFGRPSTMTADEKAYAIAVQLFALDWSDARAQVQRLWLALHLEGGHGHLWEADHIVPVVEGGDNCLSNMRTLCIPCHKAETARLASRRAHERREQRQPSLRLESSLRSP